MVGQRTLTPLILVRIQVKQPIKKRPVAGVFLLAEKPLLNGEGSDSNRAVVIKALTEAQLLSDAVAKLTKQEPERPVAGVFLLAEKPLLNGEGSDSNRARGAFCSGAFPARRSAGEVGRGRIILKLQIAPYVLLFQQG